MYGELFYPVDNFIAVIFIAALFKAVLGSNNNRSRNSTGSPIGSDDNQQPGITSSDNGFFESSAMAAGTQSGNSYNPDNSYSQPDTSSFSGPDNTPYDSGSSFSSDSGSSSSQDSFA